MRWNRRQPFVIQQELCVYQSNLVLYVDYHSLFPSREDKHMAGVSSISDCVFFSARAHYGWGYTQFLCCLLESRARRVSSRGFQLPALRMFVTAYALLSEGSLWGGSLHQCYSWCCPYIHIYIYIYMYISYTGASWDNFSSKGTMFTSLPPRSLRWSAGAAGREQPQPCSSSSFRSHFSYSSEFWSQSVAPGPLQGTDLAAPITPEISL